MVQVQKSLSNGLDEVGEWCSVNGEVGYDEICPICVCIRWIEGTGEGDLARRGARFLVEGGRRDSREDMGSLAAV